ncbi:unnamed protein product, partial [Porites evermanni]
WLVLRFAGFQSASSYRVPTLPRQVYPIYRFLIYFSSTTTRFIYGVTNRHFRRGSKVILRKTIAVQAMCLIKVY